MKKQKFNVGGQAVIEGVMMRGQDKIAVAVRQPDGEISVDVNPVSSIRDKYPILKKPLLRGVVALFESLYDGMKALAYSAQVSGEEDEQLSTKEMVMTIATSVLLAIGLFIVLPTWSMRFLHNLTEDPMLLNLAEGVLRMVIFLVYIAAISSMNDIQRVFQYHGAEHKTINCFESEKELTVENVLPCTRLHKRCGTSFLLFVMIISMVVFFFVRTDDFLLRLVTRIILVPVIAGLSYEVIRWAGNSNSKLVALISYPGLCLQKITTAEPDPDQIETAIAAMKGVLEDEPE